MYTLRIVRNYVYLCYFINAYLYNTYIRAIKLMLLLENGSGKNGRFSRFNT